MKAYCERAGARIGSGSFYRELARLVREGLVTTVDPSPDADPRRAPYRISNRGIAAFDAWLVAPHRASMGSQDDSVSVAVLFLTRASPDAARALFRSLQDEFWMRSKAFERAREAAPRRKAKVGSEPEFDSLDLLLARRQKHVAAEIQFVEELRAAYEIWSAQERDRKTRETQTSPRTIARRVRSDAR